MQQIQVGQTQVTGTSRYDVAIIPQLEKYTSGTTYDHVANLALLKLYQIYPDKLQVEFVQKILAKSIARLPAQDFSLYLCLLQDDKTQTDPTVTALIQLFTLLDTVQFEAFWKSRGSLDAKTNEVISSSSPQFDQQIREFIFGVIKMTCVEMDTSALVKYLNCDEKALASYKELSIAGGIAKFSDNEYNQVQGQKKLPQAVKFEQIASLINSL